MQEDGGRDAVKIKAGATVVFIGATLFNTETLHQREFEVPLNTLDVDRGVTELPPHPPI